MRSNFMRLSASMLIIILLAILTIGGASGRVNPAAAAQATMAGTAGAMACPAGSTSAQPGMMATMAAQMMGTMSPATMAATMMSTMGAGGGVATTAANAMQQVPVSGTMRDVGCLFTVTLSGAQESPPGDPDGSGSALVLVNPQNNTICYDFTQTSAITLPATASHIHQGAPGAAGPVVVPFGNPPNAQGVGNGCVMNVPANIVSGILSNPSNFYVNVHTSDFPNGAIRGQLAGK